MMYEKDGIAYDKDGSVYQGIEKNLRELKKEKKKGKRYLVAFLIAVGIFSLAMYAWRRELYPVDERRFTEERIAYLEEEYNMSLESAELERYLVPKYAPGAHDILRFSVDDHSDFMDNNFFGEVTQFYEHSDRSFAEYYCTAYPAEDSSARPLMFVVRFEKSKQGYEADLQSYYD